MVHHKRLEHNSARIVLSHEQLEELRMESFIPHHMLTFIRGGEIEITHGDDRVIAGEGSILLLRGHRLYSLVKRATDKPFSSLVFSFHTDLLDSALLQLDRPPNVSENLEITNIMAIPPNPYLIGFASSVITTDLEHSRSELEDSVARLRTLEALVALGRYKSALIDFFRATDTQPAAQLMEFMKNNFLNYRNLDEFAKESGRSLSTFKREFHLISGTTPHKWILSRKLDMAYRLIRHAGKTASDVYFECGFEDLSHFSKVFRQKFGVNPSEFYARRGVPISHSLSRPSH